jgi:CRISPR type III-A-associated RAMP protein Csm4
MLPALLIRLRPVSPFRFGPASGARDRTDLILHSDSLFAAVSLAMRLLGRMPEWLAATAGSAAPAVRIGSLFPYAGSRLFAIPPRTLWPPQSTKLRAKSVRFLPLDAILTLANGGGLAEDRWMVDAASQCLLPAERNQPLTAPFRVNLRRSAAVDRLVHGNVDLHATACLEFAEDAGLWCLVTFQDEAAKNEWAPAVEAAFRLLGDSGIGGERSAGWGRFTCTAEAPDFPNLAAKSNGEPAWWTLSLFSPAAADRVDWERGSYLLIERNGRVDATGDLKLASRMVEEGAVLVAASMPAGSAQDVAPEGSSHPVYRAGFAVALPIRYTPPRAPFLAPELKAAEPAPAPVVESAPVVEPEPAAEPAPVVEPAPEAVAQPEPEPERTPELLPAAPELPAIEAAPEPLQLPEPPKPVDPWGWEPQDGPAEEPPRTDDEEPKGGQP